MVEVDKSMVLDAGISLTELVSGLVGRSEGDVVGPSAIIEVDSSFELVTESVATFVGIPD